MNYTISVLIHLHICMKLAVLANIHFKIKRRQWLSPDALKATYEICLRGTDLSSGVRGTLDSQKDKSIIYWQKQQCCHSCPNHMAQEGSDASAASSKDQGLRYCANDNCIPLIIILQVKRQQIIAYERIN
jgi:hypothetical protein